MLFMLGVGQRFEELLVAPDTAHVFGWARPCSFEAERIPPTGLGPDTTLERNLVFPAIAEIVLVQKSESAPVFGNDLADLGDRGVDAIGIGRTRPPTVPGRRIALRRS